VFVGALNPGTKTGTFVGTQIADFRQTAEEHYADEERA
jgi:hypothetical protein